jgi:microcystin-dependent protein
MALDQALPAADLLVQTTSSQQTTSQLSAGVTAAPTGLVSDWSGLTAPDGWLLCDGSAVSRTTYSSLFAVVGTTYGSGDGSTTFNVPDAVGRVTVGQGAAGHSDVQTVGANDGVAQASRRPTHKHTFTLHMWATGTSGSAPRATLHGLDGGTDDFVATDGLSVGTGSNTDAPAYIVFPKIIKT